VVLPRPQLDRRSERDVQIGVAVDERAVDPGAGGHRGDADLGPVSVHVGQHLVDSLPATVVPTAGSGQASDVRAGHARLTAASVSGG
jgi:hypothetical protein